ncbi:TonB-dependent receptor [Spongiibacter sp. KMU-158]|uniref:TonB-dependent receptor n=1 Tax=Spongiibacter pelagi TaxID=2760804 RepID=A0A927BY47_9GAMM|nr:TonB-dependent receptor [Spongiibacter pelagi]MBD2857698.1 TonB-dependent receptor [Spongiibacter pelagi]
MRPDKALPLALILPLVSVAPVLEAQEEKATRKRGLTIEEVMVTAQKREEGADHIPLAISTYQGEDLQALGVTDTRDLGKLVPGFSYADGGFNTPIYTLRGVGFNENSQTASSTVGVYVNEFNLPFPIMSKGSNLDIERVEVLKGPQGTLYGRNTTGGAINYITKRPTAEFSYGLDLSYSSYDTLEFEGFVSGGLTDTLSGRLAYTRIESGEGWQKSNTRHPDSPNYNGKTGRDLGAPYGRYGYDELGQIEKDAFRGTLEWEASKNILLTWHVDGWSDKSEPQALQVTDIESQNVILGAAALHPNVANYPTVDKNTDDNTLADWPNNGLNFRLNDSFYSTGVRLEWGLTEDVDMFLLASMGEFEADGSFIPQSGVDTENTERNTFATTDFYNIELRFAGSASSDLFWQFGLSYSEDDVHEFQRLHHENVSIIFPVGLPSGFPILSVLPIDIIPPDGMAGLDNRSGFGGDQLSETAAVFGHVEWNIVDELKLTVGARYTDEVRDFNGCSQDVNVEDEPGADQERPGATNEGIGLNNAFSAISALQSPLAGYAPGTAERGGCFTLNSETRQPGRYYGQLKEDNISGRVALDWQFDEDAMVYLSLSRGYKSGSFPLINISDSSQFEPATQERLDAIEIGAKLKLMDTMQLNAAVFDYDYKDKQLRTNFADPIFGALPILRNAPKSKVVGAELDLKWNPLNGLFLAFSASYLDTEVIEFVSGDSDGNEFDFAGKPFNYSPELEYVFIVDYVMPVFDDYELSFGADYSYRAETNSSLEQDQRFYIADYGLVNARIGFAPAEGPWSVSLWSRNLTDEYYYNNVTNQLDTIGRYTGMPVTYGLSFSWRPQ